MINTLFTNSDEYAILYIVPDGKEFLRRKVRCKMKIAALCGLVAVPSDHSDQSGRHFCVVWEVPMETRVAVMSIIVENSESAEDINHILHEYGEYIIGRMGIPYRAKKINIISIALDAPQNVIAAVSGKIGKLDGVSVKTAYSSIIGS